MIAHWNRYWFTPESPKHLGLIRIIFFLSCCYYFTFHSGQMWLWAEAAHWQPVGFLRLFDSHPLGSESLRKLHYVWLISLLFSALGLFTKLSTIGSFLLGNLLVETRLSAGEISHDDLAMVVFLLLFALAPCGDALSLDQRWGLNRRNGEDHFRYRWPRRLMWVVLCSVYFGAAVSKWYLRGLDWVTSDTLQNIFIYSHYLPTISESSQRLGLGLWLSGFPLLCKISALLAWLLELCSPLALFSKRLRPYLVSALFCLHLSFYFTASSGFMNGLFLFSCWLAWPQTNGQTLPREENQADEHRVGQEGPAES